MSMSIGWKARLLAPYSEHRAQACCGPCLAKLIEQESRRDPPALHFIENELKLTADGDRDLNRLLPLLLLDGDYAVLEVLSTHADDVRNALAGVEQECKCDSFLGAD